MKKATAVKLGYHFYASNAVAWATANTRAEAIAKVLGESKGVFNADEQGGYYVYTCRVEQDADASYEIRNFAPTDVPLSDFLQGSFKMHKGKAVLLSPVKD